MKKPQKLVSNFWGSVHALVAVLFDAVSNGRYRCCNRLTIAVAAAGAVGAAWIAAFVAATRAAFARCAWLAEGALAWLGRWAAVVAWFPAAWTRGRACGRCGFLRLVAFDNVDRNQLLGEAFDALDVHAFSVVHQRDRQAVAAGAAGAADAVEVVFRELRQVVVEHVGDRRHVDAAGGDVGGDQDLDLATAQAVQGAVTGALVH